MSTNFMFSARRTVFTDTRAKRNNVHNTQSTGRGTNISILELYYSLQTFLKGFVVRTEGNAVGLMGVCGWWVCGSSEGAGAVRVGDVYVWGVMGIWRLSVGYEAVVPSRFSRGRKL